MRNLESLKKVRAAAEELARGGLAIVVDERAGTGDLVAAAAGVSAKTVNLLALHARGLTELALPARQIDALNLAPMATGWGAPRKAFAVSIEARVGVSTGISAHDRAVTIRAAVQADARPTDLISPGHVFPLRVPPSAFAAHPERARAALTLAAFAGRGEGAVLSEVLDDQGELARVPWLTELGERLGVVLVGFDDLVAYEDDNLSCWPPVSAALGTTNQNVQKAVTTWA